MVLVLRHLRINKSKLIKLSEKFTERQTRLLWFIVYKILISNRKTFAIFVLCEKENTWMSFMSRWNVLTKKKNCPELKCGTFVMKGAEIISHLIIQNTMFWKYEHFKQFPVNKYRLETFRVSEIRDVTHGNKTRMHNYSNKPTNPEYSVKPGKKKWFWRSRLMKKSCQDGRALNVIRDFV